MNKKDLWIIFNISITFIFLISITSLQAEWELQETLDQNKKGGHTGSVNSLSFSPGDSMLASGSDDSTMIVWNTHASNPKNWNKRATQKTEKTFVNSVSFSPDGKWLAYGLWTENVNICEVANFKNVYSHPETFNNIWSICFHPKLHLFAVGYNDNTVNIFDTNSFQSLEKKELTPIAKIKLNPKNETINKHVYSMCFHPSLLLLVISVCNNPIEIWKPSNGEILTKWEKLASLENHTEKEMVRTVCFNSNGSLLASGATDKTIVVWDTSDQEPANWKNKEILTGHANEVLSVCFHPKIKILASGSRDHTIKIWDLPTGVCLQTLDKEDGGHTDNVNSICFDHDGQWLISGSADTTIKVWKYAETKEKEFIPLKEISPVTTVQQKAPTYFQSFWGWIKHTSSTTAYQVKDLARRARELVWKKKEAEAGYYHN